MTAGTPPACTCLNALIICSTLNCFFFISQLSAISGSVMAEDYHSLRTRNNWADQPLRVALKMAKTEG